VRVCFLVGSADISGGSNVIFQHAAHLQALGHEVSVAVQMPFDEKTLEWHPLTATLTLLPIEEAVPRHFDLVIATWWKTALELHRFNARHYAYFVQSIESRFYQADEIPLQRLVDSTYALPVSFVTEATWIRDYLNERYGKAATLVRNGIRKDLFSSVGKMAAPRLPRGRLRVLVEGPFGVWFKNTGRTITTVRRAHADELWLLTGSDVGRLRGVDRIFSRVPVSEVPEIYRACDVLVKLSYVEGMFGPPLEMFHCGGTAVVYAVTGHDEYIAHGVNAAVAAPGDEAEVIRLLRGLKSDAERLNALKQGALRTAQDWPDWQQSSQLFAEWAQGVNAQPETGSQAAIAALNSSAWADYVAHENIRVRRKPSVVVHRLMDGMLDRIPTAVAKRLRRLRYQAECYR